MQAASALAQAARHLLAQGDAEGAERVLAPVFEELKGDAPSLHLMGLVKKAQNQMEAAERHFRAAIARALSEGAYYNDLGVVLHARGAFEEGARVLRAALALKPDAPAVRANLIRCLLGGGDVGAAEREARAFTLLHPSAEAWSLLAQVQRAQDKHEAALESAEAALGCAPQSRPLQMNRAAALERVGRAKDALAAYEHLAAGGLDAPDLALSLARGLYADGRTKEAEAALEQGLAAWPEAPGLHAALAHMRFLRGEGEGATALLEAEIARRPQAMALRLACANALHRGGDLPKAARVLHEALRLAPDAPALLNAYAIVLDELDRPRDALQLLRRAAQIAPGPAAERNLLSTLLRVGQPEEALRIARALRANDADEQYLIACEATALRMLGDGEYKRLCDYELLARSYELPTPPGYFTMENFNAGFADILRARHRAEAHPLDQTIRNGTQTGRALLALKDKSIKAFLEAAEAAAHDYIGRLPGDHPMSVRRASRYHFAGLWSTRLAHGGYLANHVHDRGWISAAYLVAWTPNEKPRDARAGWLKLGEPNRAPAGCGPEKWIEPKPGALVLFPSFFWHGVAPFEGGERVSAAFDIVPG